MNTVNDMNKSLLTLSENEMKNIIEIFSETLIKIEYVNLENGMRHIVTPGGDSHFKESSIMSEDLDTYNSFINPEHISKKLSPANISETIQIRYTADDGTLLYLDLKVKCVAFKGGKLSSYIIITEDVTEHVLKTRRIFKELSDSFEEALKANAAKTDFLLKISHDIRTPINSIIGMVTLARNQLYGESHVLHYLDSVESAARLLLEMFNEILDMSVIESGKLKFHEEKVDIEAFISSLFTVVQPIIAEMNHTFIYDISDIHSQHIYADKTRLSQCLINFINNSVKYTPPGGNIKFALREEGSDTKELSYFVFTIEDNGLGISPDFLEHLSEPFARDNMAEKSEIHGTGLGMSISYKIIAAMNGTVDVKSTPAVGTVFTITLPLRCDSDTAAKENAPANSMSEHTDIFSEYDFSSLNFLIADDDKLNREILCELLELTGAKVEAAENGAVALERFSSTCEDFYNLLILDMRMPILDGYETVRALRSLERCDSGKVPVIILTADAFLDTKKINALDTPVDIQAYLTKPLNTEHLFSEISRLLGIVID